MNSWDVFGHDWAVEMLQKHVANSTLRHAYLFTGPSGVGRRTLAIRLTQALNCANPAGAGVPCQKCRACKQIEAEQFPDLLVIRKLEDKKDLIIDQIREVSKFLSLKPYVSGHKVVLLLNFEDANPNAQNALLKTLEEAPTYGVLLLTANNAEQLLPTIISRCELMRLRPLTADGTIEFLASRGVKGANLDLLAHLAGGRPGYALQLSADESAALIFRSEKLDELHGLLAARLQDRFQYAEKLAKDKDVFRQTLLLWLSYWRDVLLRSSGVDKFLTNIDREEEIINLCSQLGPSQARAFTTLLEKAIDQLDRNVNTRLLAETTLMDLPRIQ